MPRKRKTPEGSYPNRTDLTQSPDAGNNMPYGQKQELIQSQQEQPLPAEQDPYERVLQAASQFGFSPVGLDAPTERPAEPITAGLSTGPGPGPEALGRRANLSDLLNRARAETSSPVIERMLEEARRMGL